MPPQHLEGDGTHTGALKPPPPPSAAGKAAACGDENQPHDGPAHAALANSASGQRPLRDFLWTTRETVHVARRRAIVKSHPEVKRLFGQDPVTAVYTTVLVAVQFATAYLLRDQAGSPLFWLAAYVVGGTCNHALFLAIHEITHNLCFKSMRANRIMAFVANLPVGIPYAISFRRYHAEHHKLQGVDGFDTDLPTWIEGIVISNAFTKAFFCATQICFYAIRPMMVRYQKPTLVLAVNWIVQVAFAVAVVQLIGWGPMYYFWASSFMAGSLHPCAGHFISEHYVFSGSDETFSYYGPLNAISFNVGYHNEHHDFPNIPWTRLPALKALAPEFYDHLPYHTSWIMVTWNFITNPAISAFNRVKRLPTERDLATAEGEALSEYSIKATKAQ